MKAKENLISLLVEDGVSLEMVNERFCDDLDLYIECIDTFISDNKMDELKKALEAGAFDIAFRLAHTIKGIAGNLEFTKLYESMGIVVEDLRAGRNDEAKKNFFPCDEEYKKLLSIIND